MPYEWMNNPYPHYRYYYDYGPYYGRTSNRSDDDIRESIKNNMFTTEVFPSDPISSNSSN